MKCKPGDLVVLIRCDRLENIGTFGTVVCRSDPSDYLHAPGGARDWEVKPRTPVVGRLHTGEVVRAMHPFTAWDADLHPIRPPRKPETVETAKELERS